MPVSGRSGGPDSSGPAPSLVSLTPDGPGSSKRSVRSSNSAEGSIEARFAAELKTLKGLSDAEFSRRMVDVWCERESSENLLRKALFAEACDSDKAKAFYEEFKRRKGLSPQDEGGSQLWEFMFQAGKRFGGDFMQKYTEAYPQGTRELDTIVHGWVSSDATAAVEWLNGLPEDCPYYSKALKGIVWGIGDTAPDFAARTFLNLPEEERNQKFESLGGGAINGRGITGLVEIAAQLPEAKDREKLVMSSLMHSMKQPPEDFVSGMAGQLAAIPRLSGAFQEMAGRWVRSSPTDAIAWMGNNADGADQAAALGLMAGQLSRAGRGDAVDQWLVAHPKSPGRATVEAARAQGEKR
ncbi:hypothetical protein [Luteolibacter soli]|uniref:Uncharacterized protein n=1 Tax=Luteolibacter soli TaxID=3135280 RepID=A0ABU9B1J6_9BACT